MTESLTRLFADIRDFDWDPNKRETNLRDHKIDFDDVWQIFDGYTFTRRSDRHGEVRYQVFGYLEKREVAVACAIRGSLCWIISARRARRDERQKYYTRL
ncbi:BrnT family toxin [Rhodopseudomonas boonkerdii]|uniref:BrnT family toxin n=1 Tax=Rhodopseudomonas boonkerdii TaxID=475937 RepID=UPI003D31B858|nr:BrnT family toxin [Rhodopseudomonas boonkerdii]